MADIVKSWNGSIWVDYTGGGGGQTPLVVTMGQVAGLEAELESLDTRLTEVETTGGGGSPDLSGYVTDSELTTALAARVDTVANAAPGTIFRHVWTGSGTPVRPSTRTDIFFDWEGPLPHPNGGTVVTSPATNGMYNGDRRSVTAF